MGEKGEIENRIMQKKKEGKSEYNDKKEEEINREIVANQLLRTQDKREWSAQIKLEADATEINAWSRRSAINCTEA